MKKKADYSFPLFSLISHCNSYKCLQQHIHVSFVYTYQLTNSDITVVHSMLYVIELMLMGGKTVSSAVTCGVKCLE